MFSPAQCRAGRALLGWTVEQFARLAELEPAEIEAHENGKLSAALFKAHEAIRAAFSSVNVIPIAAIEGGEGVRFRRRPKIDWTVPAVARARND